MDAVSEIKMRLPIEQLVSQYCQLQKKGRNFVCLCPFHNDSHPSFLVSPDKGIAYCFACRSGGDIFSFYQKIEGVDFAQAIRELADKTGVKVEEKKSAAAAPKKDEKERQRMCLEASLSFYEEQLKKSALATEYLKKRSVPAEQITQFRIGFAPDSFSATYEHLLKAGFSRQEILAAGMGVQRELQEERIYDRFRNRLMFPIHDQQGHLVGFGGRTLAEDDAKYINSSESALFHKSEVLFGIHHARDSIREKKTTLLVEGYFDVLACHRAGATHAVATCGTALTDGHVKLLRRYCERVTLCLDTDRAGQDAMQRAFIPLARAGMHVDTVLLPDKDPADVASSNLSKLTELLTAAPMSYLESVLKGISPEQLDDPLQRREALKRLLMLVNALPSAVERRDYLAKAAVAFGTTENALEADMGVATREAALTLPIRPREPSGEQELFSAVEISLGLFLFYPAMRSCIHEIIEPVDPFPLALYRAILAVPETEAVTLDTLQLEPEIKERTAVLQLYCEHHGFTEWSESMASREVRKHCQRANREMLLTKQQDVTRQLLDASKKGNTTEQAQLQVQMQQILKLMKMAG